MLAPAYQAYETAKAKTHARNQQQDAQEAKPAAIICMRAKHQSYPALSASPPSDTCATDLCSDWRIDDDTVGRDRDMPLLVSKSAECGVKRMQLCGVSLEVWFVHELFPLVSAIGCDMPH
jgi:hypothetical protein